MARIAYTDKETAQVSPLPAEQKWTSGDANVVKESVNAIYDADAAAGGEVMFNDGTGVGKSGDLTFDGALQIGANSNAGQIQLGGPDDTAVGTVSSNGTLTMEGEDVVVSGGESVELTTNAVSRLKVDVDGAWLVEGAAGTSGQFLKTNGAGAPPEWGNITADVISATPFFYLTSGSIKSIFKQNGTSDGKPLYEQVGGAGTVIWADAGTGLQWNVTPDGSTVIYLSTEDVADPTLVTSWTADLGGNPPLPSLSVLYGPTVQDALEQLAEAAIQPQYYKAVLTQTGTDAPLATVLHNNTGWTIAWSYDDVGTFSYSGDGGLGQPEVTPSAVFEIGTGLRAIMNIATGALRVIDPAGAGVNSVPGDGNVTIVTITKP